MSNEHDIPPSAFSPKGLPVPSEEHPRLFIRKQHLEGIRRHAKHPRLRKIWEYYVHASGLEANVDEITKSKDIFIGNALLYLFEEKEEAGRKSISVAIDVLRQAVFPMDKQDISRDIGNLMLMGAIVYDWCYPLLSKEERDAFIAQFERLAELLETGYPPVPGSSITGHAGEAMLMRDMLGTGITIYDEKPDMYRYVCEIFFNEMVPARNFSYQSHTHHQGDSYGTTRYKWEMFPILLFDRMGYDNVYSRDHEQVPYYWIYIRRPDGLFIRGGDSYTSGDPNVKSLTKDTFFSYAASYYKNTHFQYQHHWMYQDELSVDPILDLLLVDPYVEEKAPDDLPLTRYFGNPVGTMVARTGWQMGMDSPDVVVEMKVGTYYFANHQHLDAGNFQLYYKGDLAVDTGFYRGIGYNSEHVRNYHRRTIAHNCMLVYDPNEVFADNHANDGGQRFPNDRKEPKRLEDLFLHNITAHVDAHYIGPDPQKPELSYLKGNLTKAYSSDKVKEYFRSFAFMPLDDVRRPAVLIVFDRLVSTVPDYKKSWLLHSMEEPEINGNTTVVRRTEYGYNGKMVNHTLLPAEEDLHIVKVGGEDKQFWVGGRNYPLTEPQSEAGSWRVEISPAHAAEEHLFLNVIQVMENIGGPEPVKPDLIVNHLVVGCHLMGKAAIFSKTGRHLNEAFTFQIPSESQLVQIWVFDLKPGDWKVSREIDGEDTMIRRVEDNGVLRLEGHTGQFILTPITIEEK